MDTEEGIKGKGDLKRRWCTRKSTGSRNTKHHTLVLLSCTEFRLRSTCIWHRSENGIIRVMEGNERKEGEGWRRDESKG